MPRPRWVPAAAVAFLAATLYARTVGFEFVFDDLHLVVNNAFLREPWSVLTAFAHHFWHGTPFGAAYYRPIVIASLALNGRLLGWGPAGFHLVNVLLHAANAALVLILARRLGCPDRAALCAALLFAVHPAAAWPVGSIVARVDLLPTFFVLLAWLAFLAATGDVGPAGRWRYTLFAGLAFLLALLSKESAIAFLVVPILGLRRMQNDAAPAAPTPWPPFGALGGALLAWLTLRRAAGVGLLIGQNLIDPLTNPLGHVPQPARLWSAIALAGRYLLYLVAPVRFEDPRNYLDTASLPSLLNGGVLLSLLGFGAWGAAIVALWLRRDRAAAPLAFSLASFLPASNILVPIGSLYAQNFLYLPLLGLSLTVGIFLGRTRSFRADAPLSPGMLLAPPVLVVLAALSFVETRIWRDGEALFTAWCERFPAYSLAHSGLGVMLLDRGRPAEAIGPLRKALEITERNGEAHYNLGVALILTAKENPVREEALSHLRRAAEVFPDLAPARVNASKALLQLGRPAEAETEARAALEVAPGFPPALLNLAEALYRQDRFAEAAAAYEDVVKINPADPDARSNYVVALIHSGKWDEARAAAQAAREAFPQLAWFDFCLARIESKAGRRSDALALLETALAKDAATRDWLSKVDEFESFKGSREFEAIVSGPAKRP